MKTQIYIKGSLMIRALVSVCLFLSATFAAADELRSPEDMQLVQQHIGCEVIERRDADDCSSAVNAGDGDSDEAVITQQHVARLPIYIPLIIPATVAVATPVRFSPAIRAPPAV